MTGMEPFIDPFAGGLVGIVFDVARKVGGSFTQAVGDRRQVAQALKRYEEKYRVRYGTVKLLGMQKSVDLEAVYTKVQFLDELSIRQFISLEALEKTYREERKRKFQTKENLKLEGFAVANENQFLMVLGKPGGGKSTYLRRLGLEALKGERGNYQHHCIPVMLQLKRFLSSDVNLIKAIANELTNFGFPDSLEFTIKMLEQGKLLILLDGLDEVPKQYLNIVIDSIENFVTQYKENRYIASCRIAAHRSTWNHFHDIEIADFDDEQIQQFIQNWFSSDLDKQLRTAERCWAILSESSNFAAKELAQTPLLLTFLCVVYDRTQRFYPNRAILYRKALDILLEEWAAEKRIIPGEIYEELNTDLEKVLLSEIAYNGFINNQFFFTQQDLTDYIKMFLSDTVDKPKYLDGKAILDAIITQQGIFVERAEDIYSFSHLTLQHYLTAQYISQDESRIADTISNKLFEEDYREIFLVKSGLLTNSDKLIQLTEAKIKNIPLSIKLKNLINWASQMAEQSNADIKPVVKRAIFIEMALSLAKTSSEEIFFGDLNLNSNSYAFLTKQKLSIYYDELAPALSVDIVTGGYFDNPAKFKYDNLAPLPKPQNLDFFTGTPLLKSVSTISSTPQDIVENATNLIRALKFDLLLGTTLKFAFEFQTSFQLSLSIDVASLYKKNKICKDSDIENLINQLKLLLESEDKGRFKEQQMMPDYTRRVWLNALKLPSEWVNLSGEDIRLMKDYLYSNELMVLCKEGALRVSEKVWTSIEERMLTVDQETA